MENSRTAPCELAAAGRPTITAAPRKAPTDAIPSKVFFTAESLPH
jgi:hypothetical protein